MSIIRAKRPDERFYVVSKDISENESLSWGARGILIFLLGKPDNWVVSVNHLIAQTKESAKPSGRDAVYSLLKELENNGYLVSEQKRINGTFAANDYTVLEIPFSNPPHTDEPHTDEPHTDEPHTANPTLTNNEIKQRKKKITNTDKKTKSDSFGKKLKEDALVRKPLSDKQANYFASKLCDDPGFGSMFAEIGETADQFQKRIVVCLTQQEWINKNYQHLEAVGFKFSGEK